MYYAESLLVRNDNQSKPLTREEWHSMLMEGKRHMMPDDICAWKSYSLNGQLAAHTASLLAPSSLHSDMLDDVDPINDVEILSTPSTSTVPHIPTISTSTTTPSPPLKRKYRKRSAPKICNNCNSVTTPLWRRSSSPSRSTLCNACGLYLLQHHSHRPLSLFDDSPEPEKEDAMACSNCYTTVTSVWRRSAKTGELLCNACGVYLRTRGENRPAEWRKDKVKHRTPRPA